MICGYSRRCLVHPCLLGSSSLSCCGLFGVDCCLGTSSDAGGEGESCLFDSCSYFFMVPDRSLNHIHHNGRHCINCTPLLVSNPCSLPCLGSPGEYPANAGWRMRHLPHHGRHPTCPPNPPSNRGRMQGGARGGKQHAVVQWHRT